MKAALLLAAARYLGPNLLFVMMLCASFAYYQSSLADTPTWRNVAAGSMALVGVLAGLGYRDFISRIRKFEVQLAADRTRREEQHKANVAAIVALAMAVTDHLKPEDKDKVKEIVNKLLQ